MHALAAVFAASSRGAGNIHASRFVPWRDGRPGLNTQPTYEAGVKTRSHVGAWRSEGHGQIEREAWVFPPPRSRRAD
ncbi:MAG TPA: hypothetical protein VNN99_00295, partial [Vicinamibacterales bacterium]|nr:hypothetical protein [Vicinamibacterales bacterium]